MVAHTADLRKVLVDAGWAALDSIATPLSVPLHPARLWWQVSVRTNAGKKNTQRSAFYRKHLHDMTTEQKTLTEPYPPNAVPGFTSCCWGTAVCLTVILTVFFAVSARFMRFVMLGTGVKQTPEAKGFRGRLCIRPAGVEPVTFRVGV